MAPLYNVQLFNTALIRLHYYEHYKKKKKSNPSTAIRINVFQKQKLHFFIWVVTVPSMK